MKIKAKVSPTYVLYHKHCADGSGAAYAAWKRFGNAATYIPLNYHDSLPNIPDGSTVYILDYSRSPQELLALKERGCSVTLIDHHESALIEALRLMAAVYQQPDFVQHLPVATTGIPIDRFATASDEKMEELLVQYRIQNVEFSLGSLRIQINMRFSGAVLAWNHFHLDLPLPQMIRYIQDRDLWTWLLPWSQEISEGLNVAILNEFRPQREQQKLYEAALSLWEGSDPEEQIAFLGFQHDDPSALLPHGVLMSAEAYVYVAEHLDPQQEILAELEYLNRLAQDPNYVVTMRQKGEPEVEKRNAAVAKMLKAVTWAEVGGYKVPIVQAKQYRSWVGHALLEAFPEAPFAVTYRPADKPGVRVFDLRSRWNWQNYSGFNCRFLAQQFGGGGHRPAAGFTVQQLATFQESAKEGDCFMFAWAQEPEQDSFKIPSSDSIWVYRDRSIFMEASPDLISMNTTVLEEYAHRWLIKLK